MSRLVQTWVVICGAISVSVVSAEDKAKCTVCEGGAQMAMPERSLEFFDVAVEDCATLESLVGWFTEDQKLCELPRAVGPYCGCPFDREIACSLCRDGSDVGLPDRSLAGMVNATDIFPEGVEEFSDFEVTCGILQDLLYVQHKDDPFCLEYQQDYHEMCGCPGDPIVVTPINQTTSGSPSVTPVEPAASCSLCYNGERVPDRNKPFKFDFFDGVTTCGGLEDILPTLFFVDDPVCYDTQMLGELCGCTPPPDASNCRICPNGEAIPWPEQKVNWFDDIIHTLPPIAKPFAEELTCELLEAVIIYNPSYIEQTTDTSFVCLSSQLKSESCGCSPDWRPKFLTWAYRGSGILSLLVSTRFGHYLLLNPDDSPGWDLP